MLPPPSKQRAIRDNRHVGGIASMADQDAADAGNDVAGIEGEGLPVQCLKRAWPLEKAAIDQDPPVVE